MNILPKKSWHVRTKRNIERVRRDEAKAAEEELAKEARRLLAEQEARTAFLRAKAKKSVPTAEKAGSGSSDQKHINFFDDVESAGKYFGTVNKEHEEEKKAEQEKFEKNIGLLTYLGQSEIDSKGKTPWYLEPHAKRFKLDDDDSESNNPALNRAEKKKSLIDPLNDIRQYLDQKKKGKEPSKQTSAAKAAVVVVHSKEDSPRSKHKHKHHKKHKKHKKNKRRDDDDEDEVVKTTAGKKSIEELRRERLAREREERKRAEELLKRHRGETTTESAEPPPPTDERCQRYNSQFNPHIARQNFL